MIFYTQLFASKKGALAQIWLAAHWEKKITKAQVFECDVEKTVKYLMDSKLKLGLRTSGHLLLGVVRIYARKAKYYLADCNDVIIKCQKPFRPVQTDLSVEGRTTTVKAIPLTEDFTDFDALPDPRNIAAVDQFSLNQSRTEEITLKEDFGNGLLSFSDLGTPISLPDVPGMSFQDFTQQDAFGDEDKGYDLLDFLAYPSEQDSVDLIPKEPQNENEDSSTLNQEDAVTRGPAEVEPSTVNVTLLANEEEAFALEPVPVTPTLARKQGTRKRKLVVDQETHLTNKAIRKQLDDYSDLIAPLDLAPPTHEFMQWKESEGVDKVCDQPSSSVIAPEIKEVFKSIFETKYYSVPEDTEALQQDGKEVKRDVSFLNTERLSVIDSTIEAEKTNHTVLTILDELVDNQLVNYSEDGQIENWSLPHPELPSEDSMFVQQSHVEQDSLYTQSMLDSQDFGERGLTRQARRLLCTLQSQSNTDPTFSLRALCKGKNRSRVATTFFCFLVLKKQDTIQLQQSAPYEDILATTGPKFLD